MESQCNRSGFGATLGTHRPAVAPSLRAALAGLLGVALLPLPIATLLVIAPVAEELVFRLGLQESLLRLPMARRASCPLVANVLTALAFAAAHLALHPGALAALTVLPALAVGWAYQRQRRLAPCIALHAFFNAVWLLASAST